MQNNLTPRFLLIGLVLVWGLWSLWPTFKLQTLSEQEKTALLEQGELVDLETRAIKQGLDLKGGMYIALEVDIPTLVEKIAINKDRKLASVFESTRQEILISPETDFFNSFSNLVEERQVKLSRYYYDYGSNSNDIIQLFGPPSTKSTFDNNIWIYIERKQTQSKLKNLGRMKIFKNNVLVLEIDNYGILKKKKFYNKDDMENIKIVEATTEAGFKKNSFIYDFMSSMRQKINDPLGQRAKKRKEISQR